MRSLLLALGLVGCVAGDGTTPSGFSAANDDDVANDDDASADDDDVANDDDASDSGCSDPWTSGPRMVEEGADRGLTRAVFSAVLDLGVPGDDGGGAELAAHDLDGDGDVDLLFNRLEDGPTVFENDGSGHFIDRGEPLDFSFVVPPAWLPTAGQRVRVSAMSAADIDGDGLPELVTAGFGHAEYWPNLGGLAWGSPQPLHTDDSPAVVWTTAVVGDINGDGQLDVLLPTQLLEQRPEPAVGHPVLLGDGSGGFTHATDLSVGAQGSDSIASTISDYDGDGDPDVIILMDQGARSGVFRNDGVGADGLPEWLDVAADIGFDRAFNAMGMDSIDLNDDGVLDWCISDNGAPVCLFSDGATYFEGGAASGLVPDEPAGSVGTVGWTIDFADFDNDGWAEMFQTSGTSDEEAAAFPDLLFQGLPGGMFEDVSAEWGVDSREDNYAAAPADFDGDGFLDLVVAGPGLPPLLHMTRCGDEDWVELDLAGPPGNAEGFGARVEVAVGDRTIVRELYAQRAAGQAPSRVHVGLGEGGESVGVKVAWSDGVVSEVGPLEPSARYQLRRADTAVPDVPGFVSVELD
jgi:enediyne biosynthesis protein E4